jgi:hypothetical protein
MEAGYAHGGAHKRRGVAAALRGCLGLAASVVAGTSIAAGRI